MVATTYGRLDCAVNNAGSEVTGPAVRFLCSDDARFVTGTPLVLDGGFTAM